MSFTPGDEDREETARESRIKILLLVTALVLVAGYAAAVTELGTLLASTSNILSEFGPAIPPFQARLLGQRSWASSSMRFGVGAAGGRTAFRPIPRTRSPDWPTDGASWEVSPATAKSMRSLAASLRFTS